MEISEVGQEHGAGYDGFRPVVVMLSWLRMTMLKAYIIYYKFKCPGDKKPGAHKQYRIYANSLEEARRLALAQANYPDVEVTKIKPAAGP